MRREDQATVGAEKAALRSRMREVRATIPAAEREHLAGLVSDRLFTMAEVRGAHSVLVFYSFGSEIPTSGILRRLLSGGRRVLLPFLERGDISAAELRPGDEAVPTTYGPKEPPHRVPVRPHEIDLVVTPGLAFDRRGHRLGYGGGYYDRYLVRLGSHALRLGMGFHQQVVDEVPHGPQDERLHLVVTDMETIDCRPPDR